MTDSYSKHSALVYCYNCGKEGHYGFECSEQRMFRGTFPTSPFIYFYDNKRDMKSGIQRARKRARDLQKAGLLPVNLERPYIDDDQKEHGHKKKKMLKEHDKMKEKSHRKKSLAEKCKEKMLQNNYHMEDFRRGGNLHTLKRNKKLKTARDFGLPTNRDRQEILQAALKPLRKKKKRPRKKKSHKPTEDESLFLIKQKQKSKHNPDC